MLLVLGLDTRRRSAEDLGNGLGGAICADSDPDGAGRGRVHTDLSQLHPLWGRCKVTQQPDEVAYIPKTPAWVQGPATAGGGATVRKGAGRSSKTARTIHVLEGRAPDDTDTRVMLVLKRRLVATPSVLLTPLLT